MPSSRQRVIFALSFLGVSPATLLFETHRSRGAGWATGVVTWLTLESTSPTVRWRPLPQKSFLFDLMVNTLELISGPEVVR
jgi:hypothetical protein